LIIDFVDVLSPHIHPRKEEAVPVDYTNVEIKEHFYTQWKKRIEEYKNVANDKPLFINEFGIDHEDVEEVFGERAQDVEAAFYEGILQAMQNSNVYRTTFYIYLIPDHISRMSPINEDLTWRKSAFIIQEYYKSWSLR
jgi:hypothetical protein